MQFPLAQSIHVPTEDSTHTPTCTPRPISERPNWPAGDVRSLPPLFALPPSTKTCLDRAAHKPVGRLAPPAIIGRPRFPPLFCNLIRGSPVSTIIPTDSSTPFRFDNPDPFSHTHTPNRSCPPPTTAARQSRAQRVACLTTQKCHLPTANESARINLSSYAPIANQAVQVRTHRTAHHPP
jgi:hypothetical protein